MAALQRPVMFRDTDFSPSTKVDWHDTLRVTERSPPLRTTWAPLFYSPTSRLAIRSFSLGLNNLICVYLLDRLHLRRNPLSQPLGWFIFIAGIGPIRAKIVSVQTIGRI
tara:strand:- start:28 stop:354 length:327 start_codon:yes stop_codon:yes gene_type:complete